MQIKISKEFRHAFFKVTCEEVVQLPSLLQLISEDLNTVKDVINQSPRSLASKEHLNRLHTLEGMRKDAHHLAELHASFWFIYNTLDPSFHRFGENDIHNFRKLANEQDFNRLI